MANRTQLTLFGDSKSSKSKKRSPKKKKSMSIAETMASKQREISISELFSKNRHLLGFDNPKKALMTTIKEAVAVLQTTEQGRAYLKKISEACEEDEKKKKKEDEEEEEKEASVANILVNLASALG